MILYILCCHGGSDTFEPSVFAFSTVERAREFYATLPSGGDGGGYFIEQVQLDAILAELPEDNEPVVIERGNS